MRTLYWITAMSIGAVLFLSGCSNGAANKCEENEIVCDDGVDDDCDGLTDMADDDCEAICPDADADGYRDQACGGEDCDDADVDVNPAAAENCANGVDDDCDGDTDAADADCAGCDDLDSDGYPDSACGGNDCDDSDASVHPGAVEDCDDVDQDCDGVTDQGCDDDGDGWCDDALVYTDGGAGSLPVCPHGAGDCNDDPLSGAGFNPDQPEVCDGMDNDCSGAADEGCASLPPVADAGPDRFPPERDDPINYVTLDGNGSYDPDSELPLTFAWSCSVGTVNDPTAAQTFLNDIPCTHPIDEPITCSLTVTDSAGNTDVDEMQVFLTNKLPVALVDGTPGLSGQTIVRAAADADPGTLLQLDAGPSFDPDGCDDPGLTFAWSGPDVGLLSDPASPTPSMDNVAGDYQLHLTVTDSQGAGDQLDVEVVISDCVWVGAACPAAVPACRLVDTSSGGMSDRVTEGLDAAEGEGYGLVCLAQGDYAETELVMRPGVGLLGGFTDAFAFDGNQTRAKVTVADARGAYFGADATGASLEDLSVIAGPSAAEASERSAVTVDGSAAVVSGCDLRGDNPSAAVDASSFGVRVLASAAGAPVIVAGNPNIDGAGSTNPAYAYGVFVTGGAELVLAGSPAGLVGPYQSIRGGAAAQESYGVYVDGGSGARLEAHDNFMIHGCGWGAAGSVLSAGIALAGGSGHVVENTEDIQGCEAQESFALLLAGTHGVQIDGNGLMLGRGTSVSGGVADGYVQPDKTLVAGDSTGLQILGNRSIWGSDIHQMGATSLGLSAGIFLVGSSGAVVQDNGRRIGTGYGQFVIGGRVSHQAAPGGLEPIAPGLWTVQTHGAQIAGNYIQSGLFDDAPPDQVPAVAFQDGVPGMASAASTGLAMDQNAIIADVPALDATPVQLTRAVAVRMFGTQGAVLTNNLIATMSGNHLFGVRLEGAAATLTNNTIDVDLKPWTDFGCPVYLARFGIYGVDAGRSSDWVNNVVLIRQLDDPACGGIKPNDDQAAMWFVAAGGAGIVPAMRVRNNVLFMAGDDLGTGGEPDYVVVASDDYGGAPTILGAWPAVEINAMPVVGEIGDNAVADPLMIDGSTGDWQRVKNELHLDPASPCVDAGLDGPAPEHDYFGRPRPAGSAVDVGHEELP